MNKNTVTFKIYIKNENNENIENKEYIFNLNECIIDIKKKILKDTFNNIFNHLDMVNITERVYKDYGKLFFDKGLLPSTINNYKLSEFTNEGRVFSFLVIGLNIEKKEEIKIKNNNFNVKKYIKEDKNIIKNNEFKLFDNDFPPLECKK